MRIKYHNVPLLFHSPTFNDKYHAFLEARIFTLGQMLDINKNKIRHNNILFELENMTPPGLQIIHELDDNLNRIVKKIGNLRYSPIQKDKLNFFLSQTSGQISKIYRFAIRRQFLGLHHLSFGNQWI